MQTHTTWTGQLPASTWAQWPPNWQRWVWRCRLRCCGLQNSADHFVMSLLRLLASSPCGRHAMSFLENFCPAHTVPHACPPPRLNPPCPPICQPFSPSPPFTPHQDLEHSLYGNPHSLSAPSIRTSHALAQVSVRPWGLCSPAWQSVRICMRVPYTCVPFHLLCLSECAGWGVWVSGYGHEHGARPFAPPPPIYPSPFSRCAVTSWTCLVHAKRTTRCAWGE